MNATFADTFILPPPTTAKRVVLENGLTVILKEDHSAPVVSAQVWVRTGSIHENEWMGAGLSHILEHMLFKGTERRNVSQITHEVQDKGGYINAYTSYDRTVYYIDLPSDGGRPGTQTGTETAIDILADAMMNSTLPPEEYKKEQQVILREMAMGEDDPERKSSKLMWATAYNVHPYRHPVIGYEEVYRKLSRDDVMKYFKSRYVPNNMVFILVGDFEVAVAEKKIREAFGSYPRQALAPVLIPSEPRQLNVRVLHQEAPIELSRLNLGWHIPGIQDPDVPALDLLAIIAGSGRSSRLHQELVEKQGLVHSVDVWSYTPFYPGLFGVSATVDADKRESAEKAILTAMKKFCETPVSESDLRKAKKISLSNQLSQLKTMSGQAADLGSNEFTAGDLDFSRTYLEQVQKVTKEDILRAARKYLTAENLTITSLNPTGSLKAESRVTRVESQAEIEKVTLPNGVRLLLRQDKRLPFVSLRAVFRGGVLAETDATSGITQLTARTMIKGTKSRSAEQIADSVESVGGHIAYQSGNNSFGFSVEVLGDDFERGLDVLADVILNPTFPAAEIERERQMQLADIKSHDEQITTIASLELRKLIFGNYPYHLQADGTVEAVNKLKREDLVSFHRRYCVAPNLVLSVFGDIDPAAVRKSIEKKLASLPTTKPDFATFDLPPLASTLDKEKPVDKKQGVVMIGYRSVDLLNPDRFALDLIDTAYSDLGSPLGIRIREEKGLAYYVGAQQLLGPAPGMFFFYVGTKPESTDLCRDEILAETANLREKGMSPDELARAKNKMIGERKIKMQNNSEFGYMVALDEIYGLGYDNYKSQDAKYQAVTLDEIKRVAQKYFRADGYAAVVVKPAAPK
jgi:zinc protease